VVRRKQLIKKKIYPRGLDILNKFLL
jgi:hypothetical protein